MSQRINVRVADARRGSQAFVAIVALLLLVGAGVGGYWYYNTQMAGKGAPGKVTTAEDTVRTALEDLQTNLANIVKDPTKADEEVANLKKFSEEDINDLSKQVAGAPADIKVKIVALIKDYLPKLQTAIDAAYKIPGVKEKLEPIMTKLLTSLSTLGAA